MLMSTVFAPFADELSSLLPGEEIRFSCRSEPTPTAAKAAVRKLERRYGPLDPGRLLQLVTLRAGCPGDYESKELREGVRRSVDARYKSVPPQGLYREFRETPAYEPRPATLADVIATLAEVSVSIDADAPDAEHSGSLASVASWLKGHMSDYYPCPDVCEETAERLVYYTPTVRVQIDALPDGGGWSARLDLSDGMRPSSSLRAGALLQGGWQLVPAHKEEVA